MRTLLTISLVALVAACGGSEPPAQTASHPPPPLPPSMANTPPPAPAPAPAANDDVSQGARALGAGDTAGAKQHFEAARKANPNNADAIYYLALIADKANDRVAAEQGYRDALKKKPDLDAAAVNLGALLIDGQKYDDAIAITRDAIAKRPDSASLHANLATALASKGDGAGAEQEFALAVQRDPNDVLIALSYAHWLNEWKKSDRAGDKLREARTLAKDDTGLLAAIAHEMWIAGANQDCVATLDPLIAKKAAAELLTDRGMCKAGAKDDAGAVADLNAAIASDGKYAPAHFYLGGRLAAAGKLKEAVAEYETFVKLEPNTPKAKVANARIKKLKEGIAKKP